MKRKIPGSIIVLWDKNGPGNHELCEIFTTGAGHDSDEADILFLKAMRETHPHATLYKRLA